MRALLKMTHEADHHQSLSIFEVRHVRLIFQYRRSIWVNAYTISWKLCATECFICYQHIRISDFSTVVEHIEAPVILNTHHGK